MGDNEREDGILLTIWSSRIRKVPIDKVTWEAMMQRFTSYTMVKEMEMAAIGEVFDARYVFQSFDKNHGCVLCSTEDSCRNLIKFIDELDLNGQLFKAWKKDEAQVEAGYRGFIKDPHGIIQGVNDLQMSNILNKNNNLTKDGGKFMITTVYHSERKEVEVTLNPEDEVAVETLNKKKVKGELKLYGFGLRTTFRALGTKRPSAEEVQAIAAKMQLRSK